MKRDKHTFHPYLFYCTNCGIAAESEHIKHKACAKPIPASKHSAPRKPKTSSNERLSQKEALAMMASSVALLPVGKPVVWTITNTEPENLIVNDGQGRRVKLRKGERAVFQHRKGNHG